MQIDSNSVTATYLRVDPTNELSVTPVYAKVPFDLEKYKKLVKPIEEGLLQDEDQTYQEKVIQLGTFLFDSLFPGDILLFLREKQEQSTKHDNRTGLRLRLYVNDANLSNIPWEFAYDKQYERFLCMLAEVPFTRFLGDADKLRSIIEEPVPEIDMNRKLDLKALLVAANAYGAANIKADEVTKEIIDTLKGLDVQNRIKIASAVPKKRTYPAVSNSLHDQYNIVHFYLHGWNPKHARDVYLILEYDDGTEDFIDPSRFSRLFDGPKSMKTGLVVLSACESAKTSQGDPRSGLVQNLIQNQLSKVSTIIGMQYPILVEAARLFAETFYDVISKGFPVDYALQMVREAMFLDRKARRYFTTPIIFMQTRDGYIFDRIISVASPKTKKITLQQKNKIHETILQRIELVIEAHKKLLSNESGIGVKDFWESEGQGNLFQILSFFQRHMELYGYGFSEEERTMMRRLLEDMPSKLDNLNNPNNEDAKKEVLTSYAAAITILGKVIEKTRPDTKRSSLPQQGENKEEQPIINLLCNFADIMDSMGTLRIGWEKCIALSKDKKLMESPNFEYMLELTGSNFRSTTFNDFRLRIEDWIRRIEKLSTIDTNSSQTLIQQIESLDVHFNNITREIEMLSKAMSDLRLQTNILWSITASSIVRKLGER